MADFSLTNHVPDSDPDLFPIFVLLIPFNVVPSTVSYDVVEKNLI